MTIAIIALLAFIAAIMTPKSSQIAKKDPDALSPWEQELLLQLLLSDLRSIRLHGYRSILLGHQPDPNNTKFRTIVRELMADAVTAPDGLEKILSPRAFTMIIQEAARLQLA